MLSRALFLYRLMVEFASCGRVSGQRFLESMLSQDESVSAYELLLDVLAKTSCLELVP